MADVELNSSVQSGVLLIAAADGVTIDITISSVAVANSICMYSSRNADLTNRIQRHIFTAELTSSTNLRLTRHEASFADDIYVDWTVLEFSAGSINNIQTGTVDRTNADEDTTITAVDLSKTFVIPTLKTSQSSLFTQVSCASSLTSTTNLRMASSGTPTTGQSVVAYQVVEFASTAGVTVQGGTISVPFGSESNTATITSVDTSKTFLVNSGISTNNGGSGSARNVSRLKLASATSVQADRSTSGTEPTLIVGYFAVELTGSSQAVQSFDVTIADTATAPATQPSWTALSTTDTAIIQGWPFSNARGPNASESIYPANNMATVTLDGTADGATITRTGSASEIYLTGFAVDFSAGGSTYTLTAEPGVYSLGSDPVNLAYAEILTADAGVYSLGSDPVTLTYSPAGAYTLTADAGVFSLGSDPVNLLLSEVLVADPGVYSLGSDAVNLIYTPVSTLSAEPGVYTLDSDAINLTYAEILTAEAGVYTLGSSAVNLVLGILETPNCYTWLTSTITDVEWYSSLIDARPTYVISTINGDPTYVVSTIDGDDLYLIGDLC